ncbi:MAG: hypothetical protein AAF447_20630 [Myxococcota bacterium]
MIELAALTAAYWLVDLAVRRDGVLRLLGPLGENARLGLLAAATLALGLVSGWSWDDVPAGDALRAFATPVCLALAWKAATKGVDPVFGNAHGAARVLVVAAALASAFSPAGMVLALLVLSSPFGVWQHHATLPMRLLQAMATLVALLSAGPVRFEGLAAGDGALFATPAAGVLFLMTVPVSHYLITALAKGWLGPRPWSWVTDNRIHHLAASAYSWGWARFVPWPQWRRVIGAVKRIEKPMQLAAFAVELLAPLALLHPTLAVVLLQGWAAFHLGVFTLSGLLFWEWIVADLALSATVLMLPESVTALAFGPGPLLLGCVFMVALPLRHKLWKPMPLGWWDTPLTQRMHWHVVGESGAVYAVTNDFMDPHERIYGKVHGCFLATAPVCTYHLGEVYKHDLRDAIRRAGPTLEGLEPVRRQFGIQPRSEAMAARHRAYLRAFFGALNGGARKSVLPGWLRWLKAPGGQVFYWNELPKYRRQEKVTALRVVFREEYFDGEELVRLRDEVALELALPMEAPAQAPEREPTPKELDDFLLGFALGKLIDLPSFGDGYVRTDDGKAAPAE